MSSDGPMPTATQAVLIERDVDPDDVATVALLRHAENGGPTDSLCMMVTRKPIHLTLTTEEEFRVVNELEETAVRRMRELTAPSAEEFIPSLESPAGYVEVVVDNTNATAPLPQGQFRIVVEHTGEVSLQYRADEGSLWLPKVGPMTHKFYPSNEEE